MSHSERPNIVVLIADDMRWDAMGIAGNPLIITPVLDRLARESWHFQNHFATTSICPTSRASILTGQYARRHGVWDFETPLSPADARDSYPALLRAAGYHTGFVGKWGLGGSLPVEGFDEWHGVKEDRDYFHERLGGRHLTEVQTDQARTFLAATNRAQPFLLMVAFRAPHGPFQPQPRFAEYYRDVVFPRSPTDTPAHVHALPQALRQSMARDNWSTSLATEAGYQEIVGNYYRLVSGLDAAVGEILGAVDRINAMERTCVIFTSDHGLMLGEHGLRGKWSMYEASIRAPLIIKPAGVPVPAAIRALTLNVDVAPTVLGFANLPVPVRAQGRSLADLVEASAARPWRNDFLYEHRYSHDSRLPACEGVRTRDWKYMRYRTGDLVEELLFNLEQDRLEERNLAADPASLERLVALRRRCAELSNELS